MRQTNMRTVSPRRRGMAVAKSRKMISPQGRQHDANSFFETPKKKKIRKNASQESIDMKTSTK